MGLYKLHMRHMKGNPTKILLEFGKMYYPKYSLIYECFSSVAPSTLVLNPDDPLDKQRSYQYMSIIETLKLLLTNKGY
jgi:hypothetical protein